MATEQVPNSVSTAVTNTQIQPLQAWLARLGLSGKILAIGGLVGIIAVFLPLMSISMQMPANPFGGKAAVNLQGLSTSQSVMVARDARGILCLLGYVAALALAFVLYPPKGLSQKTLAWAGLGVGGFVTLLAFWLVIAALTSSAGFAGFGASIQSSIGIGAILNLLAGAAVAAGGFLKAREEKLF
jgi:hypothetical protein